MMIFIENLEVMHFLNRILGRLLNRRRKLTVVINGVSESRWKRILADTLTGKERCAEGSGRKVRSTTRPAIDADETSARQTRHRST